MSNPYKIDWNEYAALARQAVAEGCVLLKNDDNALPIRKGERVSVFGRIQFDYYKSGTGSGGAVNTRYVTNILDALKTVMIHINRNPLRKELPLCLLFIPIIALAAMF